MAIPNQTPYNIFTANGISTVFPYEFYLLNAFDLTVSINGVELTSGFTISGIGNVDGGEVTFLTPPANGSVILLERVVPTYRLTEYQDNGDLLAETVNKDFDRLWMAIQQAFIYLGLALTRPLLGGPFNAHGYRIENLGDPVNPQDAVTKKWFGEQNAISLARTLRVPEASVNQLPSAEVRANSLQGYNDLGQPVPVFAMTDIADLAIKLSGSFGTQLIGHTDLISKFYLLKDYLEQGYILVSSRDELMAAQNVIKTVLQKRTEIRLARDFAPWTAAQTDIDLAWVTITGSGCGTYIDATGIPNVEGNYFIRFYNSKSLDVRSLPILEGLRFSGVNVVGPGANTLVDCMIFHSPEGSIGNFTIGYFNLQAFRRGMVYQQNAYIIKTVNAQIIRCWLYHIDMPEGYSNYGENISFYGCTIATSSGVAVHIKNGNGGITLTNCSIDYVGQIIVAEEGFVEVQGGHHEFDNSVTTLKGVPYVATRAQTSRITLRGTKVMCFSSAGMTQPYLIRSDNESDGVYFYGVQLQNIRPTAGALKTGTGRFVIRDTQVQRGGGFYGITIAQSKYENLFIDPDNSQDEVCDWYVSRANTTVTSRTQGDNISLTNTDVVHKDGTHSLKVNRTIPGTHHWISVVAPVRTANQPAYRLYIYANGITGSVFTQHSFVAVQGFDEYQRPRIVRRGDILGTTTTLLTGATTWQTVVSPQVKSPAPAWATHLIIEINSSGISAGNYYIADAGVWQI